MTKIPSSCNTIDLRSSFLLNGVCWMAFTSGKLLGFLCRTRDETLSHKNLSNKKMQTKTHKMKLNMRDLKKTKSVSFEELFKILKQISNNKMLQSVHRSSEKWFYVTPEDRERENYKRESLWFPPPPPPASSESLRILAHSQRKKHLVSGETLHNLPTRAIATPSTELWNHVVAIHWWSKQSGAGLMK